MLCTRPCVCGSVSCVFLLFTYGCSVYVRVLVLTPSPTLVCVDACYCRYSGYYNALKHEMGEWALLLKNKDIRSTVLFNLSCVSSRHCHFVFHFICKMQYALLNYHNCSYSNIR